jgi:hypothetical protein
MVSGASAAGSPDRHHSNHVEHQCKAEELWPTHQIPRNVQAENLLQVLLGCTANAHAEVILSQLRKGNQRIKGPFSNIRQISNSFKLLAVRNSCVFWLCKKEAEINCLPLLTFHHLPSALRLPLHFPSGLFDIFLSFV